MRSLLTKGNSTEVEERCDTISVDTTHKKSHKIKATSQMISFGGKTFSAATGHFMAYSQGIRVFFWC